MDVPLISEHFDGTNSGEVILELSTLANITTVDLSLQEGHYIDERIQMSFTTPIERLAEIVRNPKGYAGVEVELDTTPAMYTVIADLRVVEIKCKMIFV